MSAYHITVLNRANNEDFFSYFHPQGCQEGAPPGAELAEHYLVHLWLVGAAEEASVVVVGRRGRAEGGQGQLGLALPASEALRVVVLAGQGLQPLQRVHGLAASTV